MQLGSSGTSLNRSDLHPKQGLTYKYIQNFIGTASKYRWYFIFHHWVHQVISLCLPIYHYALCYWIFSFVLNVIPRKPCCSKNVKETKAIGKIIFLPNTNNGLKKRNPGRWLQYLLKHFQVPLQWMRLENISTWNQ